MLIVLRNLLVALLTAVFVLGTVWGDPTNGGDGTGGWIQLPNGRNGTNGTNNGSFRVVCRVKDLDDGLRLRLADSMAGAVCYVSLAGGAGALIQSMDGVLHFPGPWLCELKDLGIHELELEIVAPNQDVLTGKIVFDEGEGLTLKIR